MLIQCIIQYIKQQPAQSLVYWCIQRGNAEWFPELPDQIVILFILFKHGGDSHVMRQMKLRRT